jgi:hypothetical protein
MGEENGKDVDIVKLWRWIKYIVKEMRILKEKCNEVDNDRGEVKFDLINHLNSY